MDDGALVGPDDLTDPTAATTVALLDAITVLDRKISELEIYSAVDPLDSTSRMIDVYIVGLRHYDVARKTPTFLQDHKSLQDIIVILGVDELRERKTSLQLLVIARYTDSCLNSSLSLRFFTGTHRKCVDLVTTFSDFDQVLSENCDDAPEAAFFLVGGLMDVTTHRYLCSFIGLEPERQAVENDQRSHRRIGNLLEVGDCTASGKVLRTRSLRLARCVQENSTSMDLSRAAYLMLVWCGLTRSRKSEEGMCENDIRTAFIEHELVDPERQECSLTRRLSREL